MSPRDGCLVLLVPLLAACSRGGDNRPAEVAATWVADRELSHLLRIVDTLALRAGGTGRSSRDVHTQDPYNAGEEVRYPAVHTPGALSSLTWHVRRNEDGRHLCTVSSAKGDTTCAPLTVVPGTSITVGGVTFQRVRDTGGR